MKQDSDNKDKATEAAKKGDTGSGNTQARKRAHPFILGSTQQLLGDQSANKKAVGLGRGETGAESQEQAQMEPQEMEGGGLPAAGGGGAMFADLKQLNFGSAVPGKAKRSPSKELAEAFAQIEKDNATDLLGFGANDNRAQAKEGKLHQLPGSQLFPKELGDLGKNPKPSAEGGNVAPAGNPLEQKKKYMIASLESNAKNLLKQLENEPNDQESERSSGEPRFVNFKNKAEKRDEKPPQRNMSKKDTEEEDTGKGVPGSLSGPGGLGLAPGASSSLFSGALITAPFILSRPPGQKGGIGPSQLGPGPQFKNFAPLGGQPTASPFGAGAQSPGEIIADTYHTYHSIGTQAPLVAQDENLSIHLASRNVKVFVNPDPRSYARSLICFIENSQNPTPPPSSKGNPLQAAMKGLTSTGPTSSLDLSNNISLLVNQNDQIQDILSEFHSKGKLQGKILDFTVRHFRYLYLLYAKSIVVLDFKDLLSSKMNSPASDLQIVDSIQLDRAQFSKQPGVGIGHAEHLYTGAGAPTSLPGAKTTQSPLPPSVVQGTGQNYFSCIEVANDREQSLLLFSDVASRRASLAFPSLYGDGNLGKLPGDDSVETLAPYDGAASVSSAGRVGAEKSPPSICEVLHIDCSKFRGGKAGSSQQQQSNSNQYLQGLGSQPGGGNVEAHERGGQHVLTYLHLSPASSSLLPPSGTSASHYAGDHAPRGRLLDTEIWDHYLALLFEKNLVIVYDLKHSSASERDGGGEGHGLAGLGKSSKAAKKKALAAKDGDKTVAGVIQFEKPIFKATFADATDSISQLFFVRDFQRSDDDGRSDSGSDGRNHEDRGSSSEDSDESASQAFGDAARDGRKHTDGRHLRGAAYAERRLHGHFLLVETKGPHASRTSQENQHAQRKSFRKLHIVQIQDNLGPLYLKDRAGPGTSGGNQAMQRSSQQSLSQIAQLTIKETNSKFVQYDAARGIVFMMNQEKQDRHIRLFTVKLKKEQVDDSDSDERVSKGAAGIGNTSARGLPLFRFRFEFITEVRLQISNQSFSAIQHVVQNKAKSAEPPQQPMPVYLQVLHSGVQANLSQSEGAGDLSMAESEQYFIYTNVMDQVLVFQRSLVDLTPSSVQMVRVLSEVKAPFPAKPKRSRPGPDLSGLGHMPDSYKEEILRKSREMMDGSSSAMVPPVGLPSTEKAPENDEDGVNDYKAPANDSADEGHISNGDGEKIVSNILAGEEELTAEEAAAMRGKQIELECEEEARQDAQQLQKKLDEAVKQAERPTPGISRLKKFENTLDQIRLDEAMKEFMSDEEGKERKRGEMEQDLFGFGLMDLGFGGLDPGPALQSKLDGNDDEAAAAEPDADNDQDDAEEKVLPSQQNLSKKEKKAQKKLEKKSKHAKKEAVLQSHDDQVASMGSKVEHGQASQKAGQPQSSPKAADKEKQSAAHNVASASQVPSALAGNAAASHTQAGKKKLQKLQEQQVVENLSELTRKYQELAQKTNQLQQLLSRQQQQKQEVDATIRKAVKDGVGERIIGQHVRDVVVPLLTKKIKSMDDQVAEVILPRVESQIETLFKRVVEKEGALKQSGAQSTMPKPQEINQMVQREFRQALQGQILPSLEASLKQVLANLEKKLQQVDVALCEKLAEEEERWKAMQTQYQNSLSWLKLFHKKVGQMAQEMIRQQMREQAQHQQTIIYQQMEAEILSKMQAQIQQTVQLQVQSKVQEYVQFQVPQLVQMQLQTQLQQYGQPFPAQTAPTMGLYPMNMAAPTLERQVSQTSAASQSMSGPGLFALQKQSSTQQLLPQVSNQALGPAYFDQVAAGGAPSGHTGLSTAPSEQASTPMNARANLSEEFLAKYRLMKKEVREGSNKKNEQLARERKLRERLDEIDEETEGFRRQMQILKKQQRLVYNDDEDDEAQEILLNFEQKQEARKQKLIEQNTTKAQRQTAPQASGGMQPQASSGGAGNKNERNAVNADDPLASFLITTSAVQTRKLQSINLTNTAQAPKADNAGKGGTKGNGEQESANDADIFRELDEEGGDFRGQELGHRGIQDSEHEDSEEDDARQPVTRQEGRGDEDVDVDDEELGGGGTEYLADARAMRPYDDDEEEPSGPPGHGPPPFGSSYGPPEGRPYDSRPQRAGGVPPHMQENARTGGNRGAMMLLSAANAGSRAGATREQRHGNRRRNRSRNDEIVDSSSSQGYQSRATHEEPARRQGNAGREFATGHRQLTSWKATMGEGDASKGKHNP